MHMGRKIGRLILALALAASSVTGALAAASPAQGAYDRAAAFISKALPATEVSSIRLHSSWSPPSMALAKAWNSAACRGLPPFRLKCSSLP